MDEDDKVWNASAVILDIDSGTQNETCTFSSSNDIEVPRQFLNFNINWSNQCQKMNWKPQLRSVKYENLFK